MEYYLYSVVTQTGMFVVRTIISIYLIASVVLAFTHRPEEVSANIIYAAIAGTLIVVSHYLGHKHLKESIKGLVKELHEETQK